MSALSHLNEGPSPSPPPQPRHNKLSLLAFFNTGIIQNSAEVKKRRKENKEEGRKKEGRVGEGLGEGVKDCKASLAFRFEAAEAEVESRGEGETRAGDETSREGGK